jgi:hypothetical protein
MHSRQLNAELDVNMFRPQGSLAAADDPVLLTAEQAGWTYSGLQVARLGPGETRLVDLDVREGAVVPLSGSAVIKSDDGVSFELAGRRSVFAAITDLCGHPIRPTSMTSRPPKRCPSRRSTTLGSGRGELRPASHLHCRLRDRRYGHGGGR